MQCQRKSVPKRSSEELLDVTVLARRPHRGQGAQCSESQRARCCLGSQPSGKASCPNGNRARGSGGGYGASPCLASNRTMSPCVVAALRAMSDLDGRGSAERVEAELSLLVLDVHTIQGRTLSLSD